MTKVMPECTNQWRGLHRNPAQTLGGSIENSKIRCGLLLCRTGIGGDICGARAGSNDERQRIAKLPLGSGRVGIPDD
jgi:hypothetical protein